MITRFLHIVNYNNELGVSEYETFEGAVRAMLTDLRDEIQDSYKDLFMDDKINEEFFQTLCDILDKDEPLTKLIRFKDEFHLFCDNLNFTLNLESQYASGWYNRYDYYDCMIHKIING